MPLRRNSLRNMLGLATRKIASHAAPFRVTSLQPFSRGDSNRITTDRPHSEFAVVCATVMRQQSVLHGRTDTRGIESLARATSHKLTRFESSNCRVGYQRRPVRGTLSSDPSLRVACGRTRRADKNSSRFQPGASSFQRQCVQETRCIWFFNEVPGRSLRATRCFFARSSAARKPIPSIGTFC